MSLRNDARRIARGLATLRPHARGETGTIALGVFLGLVAVGFHLVRPWPLKWILDTVTRSRPRLPPVVHWAHDAGTLGLVALAALYVVLTLAFAAATYGQVMLLNGVGNRVVFRFRTALFAHVLRQPLAFHESRDVGELLTRIVYDTSRLRRGLNGLTVSMAQTVFLFAGTLVVLLWMSPPLGAVLGVGAIAAFYVMLRRGRRIVRAAKKQRKKEGSIAALVADELQGVREIQTFGSRASAVQSRFARRNDKSYVGEQKVRRLAAGVTLRVEILFAITLALTLLVGSGGTRGSFSAGDLVVFLSYALALRGPFDDFAKQTGRMGRTAASASRLVGLMAKDVALVDAPNAVAAPPLRGAFALEGVSVRAPKRARGTRKWTLDDVSVSIAAGQRVAVVGGNGAGKSTLLRLALRLADPEDGRVLVDGHDVRDYAVASLRAQFSVVFQDSVLFGLSVRDNVTLGAPAAPEAAVADAIRRAEAAELIRKLPEGDQTLVRKRGGHFSPGERQRLAIARALLRDGRVWLLDEPTTALDHATAVRLTEVLLAATTGRTTLWVTHDPALIPRLDQVVALRDGRVTFTGAPSEYREWARTRAPDPTESRRSTA